MFRCRTVAVVAACAILAAVVAGCGSSSSGASGSSKQAASVASSSGCSSPFASRLAAAEKIPGLPSLPSVSGKALAGKLIVAIPEDASVANDAAWADAVTQAGAAIKAHVQVIDGSGTTTGWASAISSAISQRPAAILMFGIVKDSVSGAIASLAKSGIPWDDGFENPGNGKYLISANWQAIGQLEADRVLSQTNCKPNLLIFTASVLSVTVVPEVTAFQAEIRKYCASCKMQVDNVALTDLATQLQPDTVAALQRDPHINYILSGFDGQTTYVSAGIEQASSHVPLISTTGTTDNVKAVIAGGPQVADVEEGSPSYLAYAGIDQVLRLAAHQPRNSSFAPLPNLLITPSNAKAALAWLNSTAYIAAFKKAWGES